MFNKILIANRGEIACRIMRTAQRMGITCVAVYSEADTKALHVKLADEAYCIGPAPSNESYLRGDVIIATAKTAGAEAIHPGYGFLAENAEFAEACAAAGICFIGPPAAAIRAMGSKSLAKEIMAKAKVPLVPGYHGDDQSLKTLKAAADKIGYPVLIKAAAGGGGKGMRAVHSSKEFEAALASAKREAKASFGDDQVLLEKYLIRPRHIEVQVFADQQGNIVHLFERDCSIQRRHQKIIEEAPGPHIDAALRERLGKTAIAAAGAIHYVGAGTVELLLSADHELYFMEMNTRLQVEHPVTEMITGQDLVEWQLRVAAGEPLPLRQQEITLQGHAIEVRVYAEDPMNDFLPSVGEIKYLQTPTEDKWTRLDTGVTQGDFISPYYDPMISKLIVWDQNRAKALHRLQKALSCYQIVGVTHNLNLLTDIVDHPAFIASEIDTGFIQNHKTELFINRQPTPEIVALAALYLLHREQQLVNTPADPYSPWNKLDSWRLNLPAEQQLKFQSDHEISVVVKKQNTDFTMVLENSVLKIHNVIIQEHTITAALSTHEEKEQFIEANLYFYGSDGFILHNGNRYYLTHLTKDNNSYHVTESRSHLTAPMPGKVVALLATIGSKVNRGAGLVVIEAMKMEHTIHAPDDGLVKEWYFQVGDLVNEGAELLDFEVA